MSIVIIGIAVTGVTMAFANMVARSADPLIDVQAVAIAEAYLDEILAHPPGGASGAASRAAYATIGDYAAIGTQAPTNQFGAAIAGLGGYAVTVTIGNQAVQGVPMTTATVLVSHTATGRSITVRGYR